MAEKAVDNAGGNIEDFLKKVDEVGALIKDLSSSEASKREDALQKADEYLEKGKSSTTEGFNTSRINKYEHAEERSQQSLLSYSQDSISPEQFMKDVEEDAEFRRRKRKESEKKAETLKSVGNDLFKKGEYQDAIKYYSEALKHTPDNPVLYSNRAQAYAKVSQYQQVIEDCDFAIQLDKGYIKAFVRKGKALQRLNRFDEALECFHSASKIDEKQSKIIQGYTQELERDRRKFNEEEKASLAAQTDMSYDVLKNTISTLRKSAIQLEECRDLLSKAKQLVTDELKRTSFRKFGGFKLFLENSTLSRIWRDGLKGKNEQMCFNEAVLLLTRVCDDNDLNVTELCSTFKLSPIVSALDFNCEEELRQNAATLVFLITQVSQGRAALVICPESGKIVDLVLPMVGFGEKMATVCLGAINNLALDERFAKEHGSKIVNNVIPSIQKMTEVLFVAPEITHIEEKFIETVSSTCSMLGNLAKDINIRNQMAANESYWIINKRLLDRYCKNLHLASVRKFLFSLLGLLANVTTGTKGLEDGICDILDSLGILASYGDTSIVQRTSSILGNLITSTEKVKTELVQRKFYIKYIDILKSTNTAAKSYISKCLAVSAKTSEDARILLSDKAAFDSLMKMLHGNNWSMIGNAALCIANCVEEEQFADRLISTNMVQDLLKIAATEEATMDARHNAAIAVGKLVSVNGDYLQRVRDLHGFEILHEVLRGVQP